jgi:hypothetical protein
LVTARYRTDFRSWEIQKNERPAEFILRHSRDKPTKIRRANRRLVWSWREELNLQPAVYKDQLKRMRLTMKPRQNQQKVAISLSPSHLVTLHHVAWGEREEASDRAH